MSRNQNAEQNVYKEINKIKTLIDDENGTVVRIWVALLKY